MPEKSIWYNLCVNNDYYLEKRKKKIEEYLNYINNHKYLSQNPIFEIFFTNEFDYYKSELMKNSNFYDKIISIKNYFPNLLKTK